jgi:hypothetical protein
MGSTERICEMRPPKSDALSLGQPRQAAVLRANHTVRAKASKAGRYGEESASSGYDVDMSDAQSQLAVKILQAHPDAYAALVANSDTPTLAHRQLDGVEPEQLLAAPVASPVAAYAILAALWLWHDGLDECHVIVQKSPDELLAASRNVRRQSTEDVRSRDPQDQREMVSTLAYWHAIMHRREGDFSNSKYWLARCRAHPVAEQIATALPALVAEHRDDAGIARIVSGGWDPFAFVDLVEDVYERPSDERRETVIAIQRLEWRTLFEHCLRQAVGD